MELIFGIYVSPDTHRRRATKPFFLTTFLQFRLRIPDKINHIFDVRYTARTASIETTLSITFLEIPLLQLASDAMR